VRHPELNYRIVAGADMYKVRQLLDKIGEPLPHFLLSCAWVAEDSRGDIVGLSQVQSLPVVEPFKMVRDDYDAGEVLGRLFDMTREFIFATRAPRVLMHTSHPAMKRMLKRAGAQGISDEFFDWRR
jgi:hypothetical protein